MKTWTVDMIYRRSLVGNNSPGAFTMTMVSFYEIEAETQNEASRAAIMLAQLDDPEFLGIDFIWVEENTNRKEVS